MIVAGCGAHRLIVSWEKLTEALKPSGYDLLQAAARNAARDGGLYPISFGAYSMTYGPTWMRALHIVVKGAVKDTGLAPLLRYAIGDEVFRDALFTIERLAKPEQTQHAVAEFILAHHPEFHPLPTVLRRTA